MNDNALISDRRPTPWGTITCGVLAVITATLVGLVHLGGMSIPFRTLGPGAIITLGVLVLVAGLLVVLRSNVREHRARVTAPVPPVVERPTSLSVLGPAPEQPVHEQPSALGQTLATLPTSTLDVTAPEPTIETPAAQGAAEGSSPEEHGEAQSSH